MSVNPIRVTVWNEYLHERTQADVAAIYPDGIHEALAAPLRAAGVPLWVDVHDYDGTNPYHRDYVEAAAFLQLSSVLLPGWRVVAETRVAAGTTAVVVTHGAAGASVLTDDGWVEVPAVPVERVVDTTGGSHALALTHELRAAGVSADRGFDSRSMKSQFKSAGRSGARLALVVGDNEVAAATVTLRDLRAGDQETVDRADVIEHVRKRLQ